MEALSKDVSAQELRELLLEHTHTRLPVYDGNIDNVIGYISVKDVLALAWESKLFILRDVIRPAFFVPESKLAVELIQEMRTRRQPLAIVVDEHGGMSGIVTMEDLLEELVGRSSTSTNQQRETASFRPARTRSWWKARPTCGK